MRYRVEVYGEEEPIFDTIDEVLEYCIKDDYHEDDDYFEEWVNDCYDRVTINGSTYYPYDILRELDYSNLDDLKEQYCENENENDESNARWELGRANVGDEVYVQGYCVHVIDDAPAGDFDGDDALEILRSRLEEIEKYNKQLNEEEKKDEQDLLQIIGG